MRMQTLETLSRPSKFHTEHAVHFNPYIYRYVPPIETTKVNATVISKKVKVVRPLDVSIGFDNFEILKIDDRDFSVEINAYLIVKWKDSRIIIDYDQLGLYDENSEIPEWIPVELELVTKIWLPDSEILRLKGFHSLSVLDRLQGLWISVTHEVLYVVATRIKFMCPMAMSKFPMDVQWCKFQVVKNLHACTITQSDALYDKRHA